MRIYRFSAQLIAAFILWASAVVGYEIEDHRLFPAAQERAVLKIISTADLDVFTPLIEAFQLENPGLTIDYTVVGTSDLMQAIYNEGEVFDLAISSAMDLQTKLANDGFAQSYSSPVAGNLPDWAIWRNQLFGFTQEAAVLIVSDSFFEGAEIPINRDALIAILRDNPARFQGLIGTYDLRTSGFGYLIATQDSRNSEAYWRLMEVMGRLDAHLYCCSSEMIKDVANGKLALAYNVLGSYAATQLDATEGFKIIELNDFTNVMLRTALIPVGANNVASAQQMIDFLITLNQRPDLVRRSGLPAIEPATFQANTALRPIRFGPGLLVFLDQIKRRNFLRSWESSLLQE